MSDPGSTPPPDGTPPPPPPPPGPTGPTPDPGSVPTPPAGQPVVPPGVAPTTQMPSLPQTGPVPPIDPAAPGGPSYPYDPVDPYPYDEEPTPWYKRPGPIALLILVLVLLAALIAWLIFGGGDDDDDEAAPDSSRLIIELTDGTGQPVDRGMVANVVGPPGDETSFEWVLPDDAPQGAEASATTGTDGRVDFEWQVDTEAINPATWAATVTVTDGLPAGWSAPGPTVECVLDRAEADETIIAMNVGILGEDQNVDRLMGYSFPNYQFRLGDTVTCPLVSSPPETTETTVVETTTVETTVPETTTTTTAPAPTTTAAPEPPPTITVPPQPAATLWDVIVANPDLSGIRAWIEDAGLEAQFQDENATLTLLAPSNQAIENAETIHGATIDFSDTSNLLLIVNTHLVETDVLTVADIAGLAELEVVEPGPHAVDASTDPPTIGGATILVTDVEAANGVIQVIDTVLLPVALTP